MEEPLSREKLKQIESAFYPKSIAVVGASADEQKLGTKFLHSLLANFKGKLYPINPTQSEIAGLKTYPSLRAVPEPVDYTIISTPRDSILDVALDCAAKGIKAAHIFSAGFSETGEDKYRRLEEKLVEIARKGNFAIIGPNSLGTCCPTGGLPLGPEGIMPEPGSVAYISQSGGLGAAFTMAGIASGIRFSKVVCLGNGCDLNSTDFLKYLSADPETEIISMYIEGLQNSRRLFQLIKETTQKKPVIVLKGGKTAIGSQLAFSHTAAISGSNATWKAALKQAHAIEAEGIEEVVDTALAFQSLGRFKGNGVAAITGLLGAGGGLAVTSSDIFTKEGLPLPPFEAESINKLRAIIPPVGGILKNPLDVGAIASNPEALASVLEIVVAQPAISIIVIIELLYQLLLVRPRETVYAINKVFTEFRRKRKVPLVVILYASLSGEEKDKIAKYLSESQIPVYPSLDRAAKAIANICQYWRFRDEIEES